jgi:hypothetical protein
MDALPKADLRLYIVWVALKNAQSPGELAANTAREAAKFMGPRIANYLDSNGDAAKAFAAPLKLEPRLGVQLPAWDVYLVYGEDAHWNKGSPPAPDFWMHQLSNAPKELELNGVELRSHVESLLAKNASAAAGR